MKFFLDTSLSFLLVILFAPIFLLLGILVYFSIGSPVFFVQERPGKDGKIFKLIKFRTMQNTTDKNGNLLPDFQRINNFGTFLRSTSLDELPSLLNVLKGDLSLVGPRPLLVEYLPLYSDLQYRRHSVKPGITGWAQVNGRNSINWEEKFILDVWYVDNNNFFIDVKILFLTLKKVLKREGVNSDTHVTMPPFRGGK